MALDNGRHTGHLTALWGFVLPDYIQKGARSTCDFGYLPREQPAPRATEPALTSEPTAWAWASVLVLSACGVRRKPFICVSQHFS